MSNVKDKSLILNKKIAAFRCQVTPETHLRLSDLKDHKVVLYFYPNDNTPGCTSEGQDFRHSCNKFICAGALIFGISCDSITSHQISNSNRNFNSN